jgi:hypothetical protein
MSNKAATPLAMNAETLRTTIKNATPPSGISHALEALWFEARGDWKRAHEIVQDENTQDCAWVHAYLHRKEGDQNNAAYWYRIARKPVASCGLEAEWGEIVNQLSAMSLPIAP